MRSRPVTDWFYLDTKAEGNCRICGEVADGVSARVISGRAKELPWIHLKCWGMIENQGIRQCSRCVNRIGKHDLVAWLRASSVPGIHLYFCEDCRNEGLPHFVERTTTFSYGCNG